MNLTQAQVRSIVDLTEEQFRSWRKALFPLQGRIGQTPQFGMGDVMALLVIHELVDTYGAKVSRLTQVSTQLFEACERLARVPDSEKLLVISPLEIKVTTSVSPSTCDSSVFVVSVQTLRSRLETALLAAQKNDEQLSLGI